jgi:hypothetical protein
MQSTYTGGLERPDSIDPIQSASVGCSKLYSQSDSRRQSGSVRAFQLGCNLSLQKAMVQSATGRDPVIGT